MRLHKKRTLWVFLTVMVLASLVAACAPSPAPTAAPITAPTTAAPTTGEPQRGGTLTLGFEGAFEYQLWSWRSEMWHPDGMSHNALIRVKHDLSELIPELATHWETSADNTTYTFHLRQDVKWHDGEPFNADDVVFTYNLMCHPDTPTVWCSQFFGNIEGLAAYRAGEADALSGVEKIDDYTVRLTFVGPHPINLWWVGYLYIFPEHLLRDAVPAEIESHPYWTTSRVGTGPFKFVSYEPKQSIVYERNDDYWGQVPYIDRAVWRIFDSAETALAALEAGEIDTWAGYTAIPITEIPRFQAMDHIQIMPGPSGVTNYILVNQVNPAFPWGAMKEFRQALAHCIDKETLIATLWAGDYAENLPVSVLQERYLKPDVKTYDYNPARARELLDSIGYDYDLEIQLDYYYAAKFWQDLMAAMQAQIAECGIKVNPVLADGPTFAQRTQGYRTAEGYYLALAGHGIPLFPDDHFVLFTVDYPEGRNQTGWHNEQFEALVNELKVVTSEEERTRLYYEIQDIMAEELPEIALWMPHRPPGVNKRVHNSVWGPNYFNYYQNFQNWWLEQ